MKGKEIEPGDVCVIIQDPLAPENVGAYITARKKTACQCGAVAWEFDNASRPVSIISGRGSFIIHEEMEQTHRKHHTFHANHLIPIRDKKGDDYLTEETTKETGKPVKA